MGALIIIGPTGPVVGVGRGLACPPRPITRLSRLKWLLSLGVVVDLGREVLVRPVVGVVLTPVGLGPVVLVEGLGRPLRIVVESP